MIAPAEISFVRDRISPSWKVATVTPVRIVRKNPSWPRLAEEIRAAQAKFHRIVVSDLPPFSIGPIPQLIEYEAGKAKHVYRGERDVSAQLARVRRGEYPPNEN